MNGESRPERRLPTLRTDRSASRLAFPASGGAPGLPPPTRPATPCTTEGPSAVRRPADLGDRSPRDPRLVWARFTFPERPFRNPAARLLAEWADAVLSEEGWEAWVAAHPKEGAPL